MDASASAIYRTAGAPRARRAWAQWRLVRRELKTLAAGLALGVALPATAATSAFVESGGCRILAGDASVARMREIAAQGSVTWDGKCVNGLIEGPGVLRHEGVEVTAGRTRRFAFWLSGRARAGMREGTWRRESVNRFEDSPRVWTSLAEIRYVDGVARGATRELPVRGPDAFSARFRALIARFEGATSGAGAPPLAAATRPQAADPPARPPSPAPSAPAPPAPIPNEPAAPSANAPARKDDPRADAPASAARALPDSAGRERGLKHLAPPGTALPAPAPPALEGQRLLEQADGCLLEQINGRNVGEDWIEVSVRDALRISGWAVDPARPGPGNDPAIPASAWLRVYQRGGTGALVALSREGARQDSIQVRRSAPESAGAFRVVIEAGRLKPGDYSVAIVQRLDRDLAICKSLGRLRLH